MAFTLSLRRHARLYRLQVIVFLQDARLQFHVASPLPNPFASHFAHHLFLFYILLPIAVSYASLGVRRGSELRMGDLAYLFDRVPQDVSVPHSQFIQ